MVCFRVPQQQLPRRTEESLNQYDQFPGWCSNIGPVKSHLLITTTWHPVPGVNRGRTTPMRWLTIFLLAFGEAQLQCLGLWTGWQHNSPPHHQQYCVPTVSQHLHGCRILHVLKRHSIGTDNPVVHSGNICNHFHWFVIWRYPTYLIFGQYLLIKPPFYIMLK
jgi:hypothetical protein